MGIGRVIYLVNVMGTKYSRGQGVVEFSEAVRAIVGAHTG